MCELLGMSARNPTDVNHSPAPPRPGAALASGHDTSSSSWCGEPGSAWSAYALPCSSHRAASLLAPGGFMPRAPRSSRSRRKSPRADLRATRHRRVTTAAAFGGALEAEVLIAPETMSGWVGRSDKATLPPGPPVR